MGFSKEWDQAYRQKLHMSFWPWSDLVSYVMRYSRPTGLDFLVLELGVGAGANIPFFNSLACTYYAIDGSKTICEILKKKFPKLKNNIICADFTKEIPIEEKFDLIIDRAAVTSNSTEAIENTISLVYDYLKPNGKFIGIHWYSTENSEFYKGEKIMEDNYSRVKFKDGPFKDIGIIHFSDKAHILNLFKKFEIEILEHSIIKTEIPNNNTIFALWNFVATKKDQ